MYKNFQDSLLNARVNACSKIFISKMLHTLGHIGIISTGAAAHFPTLWLIHRCYSNVAAAINLHSIAFDVDPWSRRHPVLNEVNELGGVEVVCASEGVSIGCQVG